MPGHSRSKNGVAEPVIGPATSGRTRWLAYVPGISFVLALSTLIEMAGTSPAMTLSGSVYAGWAAATRRISPRCGS
jgi:hypothetical protein